MDELNKKRKEQYGYFLMTGQPNDYARKLVEKLNNPSDEDRKRIALSKAVTELEAGIERLRNKYNIKKK